jgi:hypothetical protein
MARHRMKLAEPKAPVLDESVLDLHADRSADARKGIDHQSD